MCLVYSKSEDVDFSWVHLCLWHNNFSTVAPNGLLKTGRICGILEIETPNS